MSESVRNAAAPPQVIIALTSIIQALQAQDGNSTQVNLYTNLAKRLSLMAGKSPAWSWRYMQGITAGTIQPSRKLTAAIYELADAPFEDASQFITRRVAVRAMYPVQPGALILSPSIQCNYPRCTVHFVPRVPWQTRCPLHRGKKIK